MFAHIRTYIPSIYLVTASIILGALSLLAFATPAFASHTNNSADTNNDGYISVAEGVPLYGGIQNSLTTSGDSSADSALALDRFPTANSYGNYTYTRTITLNDSELDELDNGHIVVHGIDIDGSGEYDGDKDSSIADGVPFEATVPAACGVLYANGYNSYDADLDELNSSDVSGNVDIDVNGNEVTINMHVYGTSKDLPHAQHIHVGGSNDCPPNTVGVDQENNNNNNGGGFFNDDRFEQFQSRFEQQQEQFENDEINFKIDLNSSKNDFKIDLNSDQTLSRTQNGGTKHPLT